MVEGGTREAGDAGVETWVETWVGSGKARELAEGANEGSMLEGYKMGGKCSGKFLELRART